MHYLIIIAIIAIIVIIQFRIFKNTKLRIINFSGIFPEKTNEYKLEKEALKEQICSEKEKEILEIKNKKLQEIAKKEKEISNIKIAENIELKSKLQPGEYSEYLNIDDNFRPYKVEPARESIIARYKRDSITINNKYESQVASKNKELSIALLKVNNEAGISITHGNDTFKTIIGSINDYLKNNKTVSDFHLMKDIVDRNCDAKEEEIDTQIPIPLYMGLVGTMAGILLGIGYLVITGDLNIVLGTPIPDWIQNIRNFLHIENAGGIENLMGGVALAMISSILGIILTTLSSYKLKIAKSVFESNKHTFLSWIQKTLLPILSDNVVSAIREMSENLNGFNREFATNTGNLGTALEKVNESYKMQVQLLETVRQIANKDVTQQNLQLYTALHNSSGEIGKLAEHLNNSNQYLTNVQALNKKLDDYENRTQFIENASKFYSKHENWLAENYDEANRKLQEVVSKYNTTIEETFKTIKSDIEGKRQELGTFIDNQNSALKSSAGDLDKIVKALSELGEVQKGVKAFEFAIKGQNTKIDLLAEHIEKLANAKSGVSPLTAPQKTHKLQIALIGLIALSCSVLAVKSFIKSEQQAEKMEIFQSPPIIQQPTLHSKDTVVVADSARVADLK